MISTLVTFLIFFFPSRDVATYKAYEQLYDSLSGTKPEREFFIRSFAGFHRLTDAGLVERNDIITIIDFRLASTERRLWVVDLSTRSVVLHSLVAHGKNSGENMARRFSNENESLQSSLGFFVTGSEYRGKHGRSLKLIGLEKDINDAAERRAIVIHGADYVSDEYARKNGRLGRSFGCPAVPMGTHHQLIDAIGEGSCVFIYYPDSNYLKFSRLGV